jgi:hypothetical protein
MGPGDFPALDRFRRIVLEDFEYATTPGSRPVPVCATAMDWRSGRWVRRWLWGQRARPTFNLTDQDLYVSFHVPAELGCRLVLGWPLPPNTLDLCVEYKLFMNGRGRGLGRGLLAALLTHGIDAADFVDKPAMQRLAARGGPFAREERRRLLDYNRQDVQALAHLLPAMMPNLDLPRAILRGRYMLEVSKIEHHGVPINEEELQTLADNWEALKEALIRETDRVYGVWQGTTFKERRWEQWVTRRGLAWPRLQSGRISLHRDVFQRMAERFPEVKPVRDLRNLLSQLRHFELPVGPDGRTRCDSYTFGTITGRNTTRASDFIFSWPKWCRALVQAPPGRALVTLDFSQEEYLIAGTLSGDPCILADYRQGDVYLGLGKSLGLIPPDGTKATHGAERSLCKSLVLACNYGMGATSLARKIDRPETVAAHLLRRHRETYARFWRWSDATVNFAQTHGRLWTKFGWSVHVKPGSKETTWRNWRVQAEAGEVLRIAVCALGAAGFQIDATVHDSVLLEVDDGDAEDAAREAERLMVRASKEVLGEPMRVDRRMIRSGGRLLEEGGPTATWNRIWDIVRTLSGSESDLESTARTPAGG